MMEDRIEMSAKEIKRLEVLGRVVDRRLRQRQAGELLGISERQVRRLLRRYQAEGAAGLVSRRRGRPSNRRIAAAVKTAILERLRDRYGGFGPQLAAEYLRTEGMVVSKETLRQWMMAAGLWQAHRKRPSRPHPPRPRRPRLGELIQIDGSSHDWLEGRGPRCTLIAFIDDATSRVMYARFVPVESTQAYLDALHAYVSSYGCPVAMYSDRHSIFTKHDQEDATPTQFQRALESLGIGSIQALTPQAKGRVERLFQTLQDRLVKAMRLAGIATLEAANAFLPGYIEQHNARFSVPPEDPEDAHVPYEGGAASLARICALHHTRRLSKDLVLSFDSRRYVIQTGGQPCYALRGAQVTVVSYRDGRIEILRGQRLLPFTVFDASKPVPEPVDDKTLNARVDQLIQHRRSSPKWRPAPDHPWRRYPKPLPPGAGQLACP